MRQEDKAHFRKKYSNFLLFLKQNKIKGTILNKSRNLTSFKRDNCRFLNDLAMVKLKSKHVFYELSLRFPAMSGNFNHRSGLVQIVNF